ncbi:hypothetical protein B0H66DRAFT_602741 [Apodospora peruviana]|uniref:Uncharacterized protein n=1 Tax=Apodospora peruviana TaxID=516989 RepID=A0AAE0M515_9PEZI|nr:hypothetical protein B0H66DRAFT_602741 [Apodospora peruviana]
MRGHVLVEHRHTSPQVAEFLDHVGTELEVLELAEILGNKELIAFNQDPVYGASAMPFRWGYSKDGSHDMVHTAEYWVGTSVKGLHLFMLNMSAEQVGGNAGVSWTEDIGARCGVSSS